MPSESFAPPPPPQPFIGRRSELEWLANEVSNPPFRRPIFVTGVAGIGKTALVSKYISAPDTFPLALVGEGRTGRSKPTNSIFGDGPPGRPIWIEGSSFDERGREFEEIMLSRSEDRIERNGLVVLDGADLLTEERLRRSLSRIFNFKRVRTVIVTSRATLPIRDERVLHLEALSESDTESLITDLSKSIISPDSMERVLALAHGHPPTISLIAHLAREVDPERLRRILDGHLYDVNDSSPREKDELIAAAKPVIISANEAMIAALKKRPEDIFSLSPRQYEELVAELIHNMGYDVTLTKATRDGGKDILASIKTEMGKFLCLVEAKHYRRDRKIGVSLVRALYGTLCDYQANSAMLVTTSSYSKDARVLQKKHEYQISLQDYADVAGWIQKYGTRKSR